MTYDEVLDFMMVIRADALKALELLLTSDPRNWTEALEVQLSISGKLRMVVGGLTPIIESHPDLQQLHKEIAEIFEKTTKRAIELREAPSKEILN
jgi:hypothetical protein